MRCVNLQGTFYNLIRKLVYKGLNVKKVILLYWGYTLYS